MADKIKQPPNRNVSHGGVVGYLTFNPLFATEYTDKYHSVQKFIDNEVLRLSDPLIPMQTGFLKKSGQLGTDIGSGEVMYIAPYASHQYYDTAETRWYDAQRGAKWFERMKVAHKEEILKGASKLFG